MSGTVTLFGGCHCGAVRLRVVVPRSVTLSECKCSICTATGYLHLIVAAEHFLLVQGAETLTEYRFNTGTARHFFCRVCGIKSFYVPRSRPDGFSVNWRTLDDTSGVAAVVVPFDEREWTAAGT